MKPTKPFPRFYAFREMYARPRTFLPLLAIFFGVILLMGNLFIWLQCELTTDVAYYKVKTQLILPDIHHDELDTLKALSWVNEVEAVPTGENYTCYVDLTADVVTRYNKIQECLYKTVEKMNLQERSEEYSRFWDNIHDEKIGSDAYRRTKMLNFSYIDALQETMFQPATIPLVLMAMAMLFAVTVLVYRMKLDQSVKEYACLSGLGLTIRDLAKIQTLQGWVILTITYVPATALAIGTMWAVSALSKGLYPAFDGNQALLFDIPWSTLLLLFFLYGFAIWLGILVCMNPFRKRTVSSLLTGMQDKIPFIEKSSAKFLISGSFEGYGKLWKKRNRKNIAPVMVLFSGLILLPAFLFGGFLGATDAIFEKDPEGVQVVCSLSPAGTSVHGTRGIPYPLLQKLADLPEIADLEIYFHYDRSLRLAQSAGDEALAYPKINGMDTGFLIMTPLSTDGTDAIYKGLAPDEIVVGEDFPGQVGDTVTLVWNGMTKEARIGKKHAGLNGFVSAWDQTRTIHQTALPMEMYNDFLGQDTLYLSNTVYVYAEVNEENIEDILNTIALATGDSKLYINDYDRRLHGMAEKGYVVNNVFYNERIWRIQDTFIALFMLTQTTYLILCAAAVIGTTIGFQLRRRKGEFAVLRALGLSDEHLYGVGTSYAGVFFRVILPILYPLLVLLFWTSSPDGGILLDDFGKPYIGALPQLLMGLWTYAVTCVLLLLLYGGVSHGASKQAVRDMIKVPLAAAVKERE